VSTPDGGMAEIVALREPRSQGHHEAADRVFSEMLTGWQVEMAARHLSKNYVVNRAFVVTRFREHCEADPWEWRPEFMNLWSAELVAEGLSGSTIRSYQGAVRQFCDHITNPAYEWTDRCLERFGTHPVQICFEWNTTVHVEELECDPVSPAVEQRRGGGVPGPPPRTHPQRASQRMQGHHHGQA